MTLCECGCGVFFTKSCERQRFASEKCRKKAEIQRRNGAPGSARLEAMRARWRGEKVTIQARKREAMDAARPFLRQPSPVIWRALGVRP